MMRTHMIFPPASPVAPGVIENPVPAESRIGKPYQNLYQTESDGFVPEDVDTHGTHVKMRQNGTKTGRRGAIPTLASSLNRVCGKDLGFFHTRVPAEVPAKNYPGSF
jgi:hypothetical protein